MKVEVFSFEKENNLIVASINKAVGFFLGDGESKQMDFAFWFTQEELVKFRELMLAVAENAWPGIQPKDATGLGSDYAEYYDKELDNNGYLTINEKRMIIERPTSDSTRMYLFTKAKMQSFLFDLDRMVNQ